MRAVLVGLVMLCAAQSSTWAQGTFTGNLEPAYEATIQPLLQRYCNECHSADLAEADIDLVAFKTLASVRDDVKTWLKVRQMLDTKQMPPKDSLQPTDTERSLLHSWVRTFLTQEATAMDTIPASSSVQNRSAATGDGHGQTCTAGAAQVFFLK